MQKSFTVEKIRLVFNSIKLFIAINILRSVIVLIYFYQQIYYYKYYMYITVTENF